MVSGCLDVCKCVCVFGERMARAERKTCVIRRIGIGIWCVCRSTLNTVEFSSLSSLPFAVECAVQFNYFIAKYVNILIINNVPFTTGHTNIVREYKTKEWTNNMCTDESLFRQVPVTYLNMDHLKFLIFFFFFWLFYVFVDKRYSSAITYSN